MMRFVLGAAVGYVLGARAGRERYDQLVRTYHRITEHPAVQSAAGVAREKVTDVVAATRGKLEHDGRPDGANHVAVNANGVSTTQAPTSQIPRA